MAMIDPATLERVRLASSIVEVVGAVVPLKQSGANFSGLCPFHKERTPSFSVNPHKQIFYCFGCHKGGDVFTFIKEYESLTFVEAVKRLAERAHIPLEFEYSAGQKQAQNLKESLWTMHEQITRRWQTALASDPGAQIARDYLVKRGVTQEAIDLFRIGYAPDAWDDTVNWAKSRSFDMALVEQGGLIIHKEGTDRYYDRFRGRLMFPICDEQGRVVAFSGRVLSGDAQTAKYVNSPETPIFTKGRVFFGLDKSKRAILDTGFAVVCEGQLDMISCYMAGVQNIVGSQGTAFTGDHARLLKRYAKEVVLCFDSDNAGQKATVRVMDLLLGVDFAIRVAVIPPPHDPDSFIKEKGGEAFKELIAKAEGFFDFYLKRLCATNDIRSDIGRKTVVKEIREALWKTGDVVLQDAMAQKTALALGVSADSMRTAFKMGRSSPSVAATSSPFDEDESFAEQEIYNAAVENALPPPPAWEIWMLRLILSEDELVPWVADRLDTHWLTHPSVRTIVEKRLAAHSQGNWSGVAALLSELEEDPMRNMVAAALADPHPLKNAAEVLQGMPGRAGALERIRNDFVGRQLQALTMRMSRPDISDAERVLLLQQQMALRELKRTPI